MKVTFDTAEFVRSHGKQPRSQGRGAWFFRINLTGSCGWSAGPIVSYDGTLAEAKRFAKDRARMEIRSCGAAPGAFVEVLP